GWLWCGLRCRRDSVGMVEPACEANVCLPLGSRRLPALFSRDRLKPVQETRSDCRRAADFRRMTEDHFVRAKQLGEVVRGKTDATLRQVEAELVPHGPAQPRIDARRGRPYALDQPADDDAIGLRQPRLQ